MHGLGGAQPLLAESEGLARALGSAGHFILARTCIDLSWTMIAVLDLTAAHRYGQEGLALGAMLDDLRVSGEALIILGAVASEQGDYETARRHFDAAVTCTQARSSMCWHSNLACPRLFTAPTSPFPTQPDR